MPVAVVLLAAGSGRRVGAGVNKVLLPLHDGTVLSRAVRTALEVPDVVRLLLVTRVEDREEIGEAVGPLLGERDLWLVPGGAERSDSERAALEALRPDIESGVVDVVVIHDVARPLAGTSLYERVVSAARTYGGAVPARPLPELLGPAGPVQGVGMQTPQAFAARHLLAAYDDAAASGLQGTDTASYLEGRLGVRVVAGEAGNLKVTYPGDLPVAERL